MLILGLVRLLNKDSGVLCKVEITCGENTLKTRDVVKVPNFFTPDLNWEN